MRSSVVFPQPEGPSIPVNDPRSHVTLVVFTASTTRPSVVNVFRTLSSVIDTYSLTISGGAICTPGCGIYSDITVRGSNVALLHESSKDRGIASVGARVVRPKSPTV